MRKDVLHVQWNDKHRRKLKVRQKEKKKLPRPQSCPLTYWEEAFSFMAQTMKKTCCLQICITNSQPWTNILFMKPQKNNCHTFQNDLDQLCAIEI